VTNLELKPQGEGSDFRHKDFAITEIGPRVENKGREKSFGVKLLEPDKRGPKN